MFDRITFDPCILGGRASIRGMRIPISVIVGQIAHVATWDEGVRRWGQTEFLVNQELGLPPRSPS